MEWLERVLAQPERTESDKDDPEVRHALAKVPEFGGRVLRVVYRWKGQPWQIITAYFDRGQKGTP